MTVTLIFSLAGACTPSLALTSISWVPASIGPMFTVPSSDTGYSLVSPLTVTFTAVTGTSAPEPSLAVTVIITSSP